MFPGREMAEAYAATNGEDESLPDLFSEAESSKDWELRHFSFTLQTRFDLYRRNNLSALEAAGQSLDSIPHDDMSVEAEDARIETFSYLTALHGMSRDTVGAVRSAERQELVEKRSGRHVGHVTTLYNLAMVFAVDGDTATSRELFALARQLPEASEPHHGARLNYGYGKLLTQEGEFAAAIPVLEDAAKQLRAQADPNPILVAATQARLALAHSHEGDITRTRTAKTRYAKLGLKGTSEDRFAPMLALADANIARAEGDSATASEGYLAHIRHLEREKNVLIRKERSDAVQRAAAHEAVFDARARAAELKARNARRLAVGALAIAFLSGLGLFFYMRLHRLAARLAEERLVALRGERGQRARAEYNERLTKEALVLAEAGEQAKEDFLSIMGHETRTPLNGILPVLHHIHATAAPEMKVLCRAAITSANSLAAMMDNVAVLTGYRAGKIRMDPDRVDVGELVTARVDAFRSGNDAALLDFRLRDDLGGRLYSADSAKVVKCVDALLDNAARFTGRGRVVVSLLPDASNGGFHIAVGDDGPGMNPETVERLRQPFSQADTSRTRVKEGLGIGLAVVDTLVSVMGGRMRIDTRPGQGTTVVLSLPDVPVGDRPLESGIHKTEAPSLRAATA